MSLGNVISETINQIIRKAKENERNGVSDNYNDILEQMEKELNELGKIFGKESILLSPKKLRDVKPKDKRSKRQKRLEGKRAICP